MSELVVIPEAKLMEMIRTAIAEQMGKEVKAPNPKIRGIHGLAEALNISVSKAQKLKNSGKINFYQDGKLVLFDYDQVISDLQGVDLKKRGRPRKY